MGPCAVKPHKITALSCCKLTSEVHKAWRKHCPVNVEAGRWGVQLPFNCLHLQTVHFEMFTSHHFSFCLTYLLVTWSYVLLSLPDFFWKLQEFWTMLVCFLTNFLGQLGTSLQSQSKKKWKVRRCQLSTDTRKHIWDHVQVAAVLYSSFNLLSLVSVTGPLA